MQQWHEANGIPRNEVWNYEDWELSNKTIHIHNLRSFQKGFDDLVKLGIAVIPGMPTEQKYYCIGWLQAWVYLSVKSFNLMIAKHLLELIIQQQNKPCAFAIASNPKNKMPGWIIKEHRFTGAAINLTVYLVRSQYGECFWTPFAYGIEHLPPRFDDFDWSKIEKVKHLPIDYNPELHDWLYDEF
ncbi:MAG: hypothetical protein WBA93_32480 [Microcoleaceae cyanobacterium]